MLIYMMDKREKNYILKNEWPLINYKMSEITIDLINLIHMINRYNKIVRNNIGRGILDNKVLLYMHDA